MKNSIKIGDILVYVMILFLVGGSFLGLYRMRVIATQVQVIIEQDGKLVQTISITDNMEMEEVRIDIGNDRYNLVRVSGVGITIQEANCPDQICVKSGSINFPGQVIVCLPHRLVIKVIGSIGDEPPLDAIAS